MSRSDLRGRINNHASGNWLVSGWARNLLLELPDREGDAAAYREALANPLAGIHEVREHIDNNDITVEWQATPDVQEAISLEAELTSTLAPAYVAAP